MTSQQARMAGTDDITISRPRDFGKKKIVQLNIKNYFGHQI